MVRPCNSIGIHIEDNGGHSGGPYEGRHPPPPPSKFDLRLAFLAFLELRAESQYAVDTSKADVRHPMYRSTLKF